MEITKREIIVSAAIIAAMLTFGFFISSAINNSHLDKVQVYNTALSVENTEMFEYGMKTNVGNAFVNGHLKVLDPVSYEEIDGQYWYVEKITEKYRQHTRVVTYTDDKGKTHTRTEVYWSWDKVASEDKCCKSISFLGVQFPESKIAKPYEHHIATVSAEHHERYVFNGISTEFDGTIFTKLYDGTISDRNQLYTNKTIAETKDYLISMNWCIPFWIGWILLTGALVYGFYYIDNEWLE